MPHDIIFPSSILLLKFLYKLFFEQEVKWADAIRAFCTFPIDIGFLAISFFVAFLYSAPSAKLEALTPKDTLGGVVIFLAVAALITVFCKKTDKAILADKYLLSLVFTPLSYALSLSLLYVTLRYGVALR